MIKIFNQPKARTDIGEPIARQGVKCTIDIPDGLLQDLLHICYASKVEVIILRNHKQIPYFILTEKLMACATVTIVVCSFF